MVLCHLAEKTPKFEYKLVLFLLNSNIEICQKAQDQICTFVYYNVFLQYIKSCYTKWRKYAQLIFSDSETRNGRLKHTKDSQWSFWGYFRKFNLNIEH